MRIINRKWLDLSEDNHNRSSNFYYNNFKKHLFEYIFEDNYKHLYDTHFILNFSAIFDFIKINVNEGSKRNYFICG